MLQTDIAEAKARALRLLFEIATPAERVDTLAAALSDWRYVAFRSALEGAARRSPRLSPLPSRRR